MIETRLPEKEQTGPPKHEDHPTSCTIGIVTYKRLDLLSKLLDSLVSQVGIDHLQVKVVVVDNDPDGSAQPEVVSFTQRSRYEVAYSIQPEQNIALSRNRCVELGSGDYMVFIDDDEFAHPDWLATLVQTIQTYDVAAVFGKVKAYYHPESRDWLRDNFLFNKRCGPTGTLATYYHTANCIVPFRILNQLEGPFGVEYGKSSGEDTHLFDRIGRSGGKMIYCDDAVVEEYVPLERTNEDWLLNRARRTGNIYARRQIELNPYPVFITKLYEMGRASLNMALCQLFRFFGRTKKRRLHWKLKYESNVGRVLAVFNHSIYWDKSSGVNSNPYA